MKVLIASILFVSNSLFAYTINSVNNIENCIIREAKIAQENYTFSSLSSVVSFENYVKLQCSQVIQYAFANIEKEISSATNAEIINEICPNCLQLKVRFEAFQLKDWGIQRNNKMIFKRNL